MWRLIKDQFLGPYLSTRRVKTRSSSALHGPLILSGLLGFLGVLPDKEDSEEEESDEEVEDEHLFIASIVERERERELKSFV